jgi:molybdate transport system substrate-binding protein
VLLSSFAAFPQPTQNRDSNPLIVAAASDLAPLESSLNSLYEKTYSGGHLRFSTGSSGQLATQIRGGAPYDVYLAASYDYARDLQTSGHLTQGSVTVYATGRLGIFSIQTQLRSVEALTRPEVKHIAIANPAHAPYGVAARQFLQRSGLLDRLKPKLVYGENVRQTLQLAESGNADIALVAWSLVLDKDGVLLPGGGHDPIRQAGGIVASSPRKEDARRLFDLLKSPDGQALLKRFGFDPPR